MSARELVVLGTSSQVPTKYRNHNGYLLRFDGVGVLFDPGEGTQRQLTLAGLSAHAIHHICITHFHGDHCLGLPGIIQRISLEEVPHPVSVHYPQTGQRYFERLRYASIYVDRARIDPAPHPVAPHQQSMGPWTLHSAPLDHNGVDATGYRLQQPDTWRMDPDALQRAGLRGRDIGELKAKGTLTRGTSTLKVEDFATRVAGPVVAFIMDTRLCDAAFALAEGADLLICESTFLDADAALARSYGHMTAADAARLAQECGVGRLVLTHFSQRYPVNAPFEAEARRTHDDVVAATDLAVIPFPPPRAEPALPPAEGAPA